MLRSPGVRFRFVLFVNNCGRDELWTNESWLVDGLGTQLRRFRKSHQLIRDRPALIREIARATPRGIAPATFKAACRADRVRI